MMRVLGVALLTTYGCSLATMEKVPANHRQLVVFDCTSSRAAPVFDVVWGGLNAVGAAAAIVSGDKSNSGPPPGVTAAVGIGWAILSVISATKGFQQAQECKAAKQELYVRLSRQPPAPAADGCRKDTDCKGDRICVLDQCASPGEYVAPRQAPPAAAPVVPVPARPAAPPPPAPAPTVRACESDADCDRGICFDGACRN
jgi:hypothetical protein